MHSKPQLLKLHFSQLILSWSKSKLNKYSDKDKQEFHNQLNELIHKIKEENFDTLPETDLSKRKTIIDFIFTSLEFLDKSVINSFPLEIVECLNVALNEWNNKEDSLIATSLNNSITSFSFLPSRPLDDPLFVTIKNEYGIEFKKRLIQINLPKYFARDYFANVALYHELGHFVDTTHKISSTISKVFYLKLVDLTPDHLNEITNYFPYITSAIITENQAGIMSHHLGEYFSDLFAAQYIKECANLYIEYISDSGDKDNTSMTHPSTKNRIRLVKDFIEGKDNFLVTILSRITEAITSGTKLERRYKDMPLDDFKKLLPITIQDKNDLSSLFIAAWKLWMSYSLEFERENKMEFTLLDSKRYEIINNLVEKSISNYIITQKWTNTIPDDTVKE